MTTFRGIPKEVNVVANGFRGVTVMAHAIGLAWCLDVETGRIDG